MQSRSVKPPRSGGPKKRRSLGLPEALLFASSLVLGVAVLEVGLHLLTPFPIHSDDANRDPHEALGYVVSPAFADIDEHGFRNPAAGRDERAEIDLFALGDSHTFGQNVASEDSWPQQLGRMANLEVYNYGVGGYGLLQYAYLFERALARRPRHIVIGLYLANDLARFCQFARMPYWRETLAQRGIATAECELEDAPTSSWGERARSWSKSTALGSALLYHLWYPLEARLAESGVDTTAWELRYAEGRRQTFLSTKRLETGRRVMDLSDPGTAAADRAAHVLFEDMAQAARRKGAKLSILFIPSKESAILDSLAPSTPHLEPIRQLVERERALIERYQRLFRSLGVQTASGRALLSTVLDSTSVYPESTDSHPLAAGYLSYAEAALPLVTERREQPELPAPTE